MKAEHLLEVVRAGPFEPFTIHAESGAVAVRHPEQIAVGSRLVVVIDADDRSHRFDTALIDRIEIGPPSPAGTVSGPPNGGE